MDISLSLIDIDFDNQSLNSETLEETFHTQIKQLPNGVYTQGKEYVINADIGDSINHHYTKYDYMIDGSPGLRRKDSKESHAKIPTMFAETISKRKDLFQKIFDQSHTNLSTNMNFLADQSHKVQKLVSQGKELQQRLFYRFGRMQDNISNTKTACDEIYN